MSNPLPADRRPGRPTREQAAEIDLRVLKGARRSFLEHGPNVSMDDVAAAVGVTKLTIYRRFPSKDDLLLAVIDQDLARVAELLTAASDPSLTALDNLKAVARAFFGFIVESENIRMSRMFIRDLYDSQRLQERVAHWRDMIREHFLPLVETSQASGVLRADDPALLSDVLLEMLSAQAERLRYTGENPSPSELASFFDARWGFFLRGAASDFGALAKA